MLPATPEIAATALAEAVTAGHAPQILDVRSAKEYRQGHIPGAVHVPFWMLPFRGRTLSLARDEPLVVYCGHGPRALIARTALERHGFNHVILLSGHMQVWNEQHLPLERGAGKTGPDSG